LEEDLAKIKYSLATILAKTMPKQAPTLACLLLEKFLINQKRFEHPAYSPDTYLQELDVPVCTLVITFNLWSQSMPQKDTNTQEFVNY
jgi:hypothetical protein